MSVVIYDCEVFAHDWIVVFKDINTGEYLTIHNDKYALINVMTNDLLFMGFNSKHYDYFIIKGIVKGLSPEEIKAINDFIIIGGMPGWECPTLKDFNFSFNNVDLMDDCQQGLSLKAIEAHLGMDIRESTVDFNIDRPLTAEELEEVIFYCKHDVDATAKLYELRKDYLQTKLYLGRLKGTPDAKALAMTNAKLTAEFLDANDEIIYLDEREYEYPKNLLTQYIPDDVFYFFNRLQDENLTDEEVFSSNVNIKIGDCQCTIGYGGIHGAIPTYREKATKNRSIRNRDVASYYPHLMTLDGYYSRAIPNPQVYADLLEERIQAKKSGDKAKANALKLVANTTYGCMLNRYNKLYDPLNARSVCITGQLRLLELAEHLVTECSSMIIIQLNTDGIMVSLDNSEIDTYNAICDEWQHRTGFELEEDSISEIIQKDVNNYIEIATDGSTKTKGGLLVRGIAPAGAFNVNNNAPVIAKAIMDYFVKGIPPEETVNKSVDILEFQLVAKASHKYSGAYQIINGEKVPVQRCNRVYASKNKQNGTLFKTHKETGTDVKIAGLPDHCVIDNNNELHIKNVDRKWYINQAKKYIDDFLGIKPLKKNTRKINTLLKEALKILEGVNE